MLERPHPTKNRAEAANEEVRKKLYQFPFRLKDTSTAPLCIPSVFLDFGSGAWCVKRMDNFAPAGIRTDSGGDANRHFPAGCADCNAVPRRFVAPSGRERTTRFAIHTMVPVLTAWYFPPCGCIHPSGRTSEIGPCRTIATFIHQERRAAGRRSGQADGGPTHIGNTSGLRDSERPRGAE